jgi:hypothetical protein
LEGPGGGEKERSERFVREREGGRERERERDYFVRVVQA